MPENIRTIKQDRSGAGVQSSAEKDISDEILAVVAIGMMPDDVKVLEDACRLAWRSFRLDCYSSVSELLDNVEFESDVQQPDMLIIGRDISSAEWKELPLLLDKLDKAENLSVVLHCDSCRIEHAFGDLIDKASAVIGAEPREDLADQLRQIAACSVLGTKPFAGEEKATIVCGVKSACPLAAERGDCC